jgi:hypothetical protein
MIGRESGAWCGCILDRIYVLFSTALSILGVIIFVVVFDRLPAHSALWIVCMYKEERRREEEIEN